MTKKLRKQRPKDLLRPNLAAMRGALRRRRFQGAMAAAFDRHVKRLVSSAK